MKIGVCASPYNLALLAELGYDYFEANLSWLTGLDEDSFRQNTAKVERYSVPAEAYNMFFRGGMKLYEPSGDQTPLLKEIGIYVERAFSRAEAWGGKVAVIGSGYVRAVPEGMTKNIKNSSMQRACVVTTSSANTVYGCITGKAEGSASALPVYTAV